MTQTTARRSVEEHRSLIGEALQTATTARAVEAVAVGEAEAVGRVVAAEVTAPGPLPGHDDSQMDGYAVRAADVAAALAEHDGDDVARLPCDGVVPAGSSPGPLPPGTCRAIMTGAVVPEGADLILPVEKTAAGAFAGAEQLRAAAGEDVVFTGLTPQDVAVGRFIRRAGDDVAAGETVLTLGQVLTPARLGLAAACGAPRVQVFARLRALVLTAGDELRAPDEELAPGQIHDANAPLIAAWLREAGCGVTTAAASTDDVARFAAALDAQLAATSPQLVVTSGGISAGAFEVVREVLSARGVRFGPVAQQPGGPQGVGVLSGGPGTRSVAGEHSPAGGEAGVVAVVCLPGNPVSTAVSLETLLREPLAAVDPACPAPRRIRARLRQSCSSPSGLRQHRRVRLAGAPDGAGVVDVELVGGPGSHLLGHLARAEALLQLTEDDVEVPADTVREAVLLPGTAAPDPPAGRTEHL
ncbi:gephyrin-like molybdotransferase Glp [Nesterenkonia sp. F]|uniref:molybdopterin molybdotransferase MoeA n=1 Tax=Nesterenkonia sp. F TaxID=795955 RepID=UPI000255C939|nr:gephyrin-like molybdotransferase Glp [Nesterenkonia sp. F]